jgi:5-epi-alpha-selinene synthase
LYCPFPSSIHPLTAQASEQTLRWAHAFGLVSSEHLERQAHSERFTWLVGRFFPNAPPQVLQLISDWTSWLFWHDDVCDETDLGSNPSALQATFSRLFEILSGTSGARGDSVFELALEEMATRFRDLSPDRAWFLRFCTSVREYFDACVWEAENRVKRVVPSVGSFIPLRRCAGGMWIYLDFVELVGGASLPLPLRKHRDVQRLVQITNNVASWHNDVFSLAKESRQGDVHNLVTTLQVEMNLPVEEALRVAARYADSEVKAFIALEERLKSSLRGQDLDAELSQYLQGLRSLMRGNLDWSQESGRYSPLDEDVEHDARAHSDIRALLSSRRAVGQ